MAVKFLSGVSLEGNDLVNVHSIEASSATFEREVTFADSVLSAEDEWYIESGGFAEFKDSIRTPVGEIGVLDMQSKDSDIPSGIIVFDMNGGVYEEDALISGIAYRGDDLSIKNGRDIYFYTHGNGDPGLVISDVIARFIGSITCGEGEGISGGLNIYDANGDEATCINGTNPSWIGGNLRVWGDLDAGGITISADSDTSLLNTYKGAISIYNGTLLISSSGVYIAGDVSVGKLVLQKTSTGDPMSYIEETGEQGTGDPLVIKGHYRVQIPQPLEVTGILTVNNYIETTKIRLKNSDGESDSLSLDANGNVSCLNFAADNITADAVTVGGSAVATKTYVDEMFNKLMTNPDETINSITELLALIESNKENLGNRYNDTFEGDGTTKTFTVNHEFNTWNVVVAVYDNATRKQVFADVTLASADAVTIEFGTAPAEGSSYEVIVLS